jgi:serine/threonine protein kinase
VGDARQTILIVDDEKTMHHVLECALEPLGCIIRVVESGGEALDTIDETTVDLVILDITMPGLTGLEVLDALRDRYESVALPVIMLTATDSADTVIEALRRGANDYITKPVDLDLVVKRTRMHLALQSGHGQMIGNYRIDERLGLGGMGTVYAAVDVISGQRVAIKVLRRALTVHDDYVMRFLREARLASRLEHPNLVRCLGGGCDDETYFLAMELAPGVSLRTQIGEGPLPARQALDIARQLASALQAVEAAGLVHRDVKPDNVIVDDDGTARLTDFGIAREATGARRVTQTGRWIGSIVYASPEQLEDEVDYTGDIYSLGCTLFAMLTGTDPFDPDARPYDLLKQKKRRSPRARARQRSVPKAVSRYVERMMAPKAHKRPATFGEVTRDIEGLLESL